MYSRTTNMYRVVNVSERSGVDDHARLRSSKFGIHSVRARRGRREHQFIGTAFHDNVSTAVVIC